MKKMIIAILLFSVVSNGFRQEVRQSWEKEYEDLQWEFKYFNLISDERKALLKEQTYDQQALIWDTDKDPLDVVVRRTQALIDYLNSKGVNTADLDNSFQALKSQAGSLPAQNRKDHFFKIKEVQRKLAFRDPILNFDKLLFNKHKVEGGSHMVTQYTKLSSTTSDLDQILILENPFSESAGIKNILENSVIEKGSMKGEKITGNAFQPDLSFDGKKVAFMHKHKIFSVNLDGSNLTQLTNNLDWDPCWIPGDDRVVFVSLNRGGSGRCHTKPTYTMYDVAADGTDRNMISYHETNEWHPSINNDGMLVYTRWDYVDRDSDIAHHIWLSFPDGRDPRAPHGNYPHPYTTLPGVDWYKRPDAGRGSRPWMEMNIRAVPGSPKYTATAAPHHGRAYGSLVMIDPRIVDDGIMSQVKRITPMAPFPESETEHEFAPYGTSWPLDENLFLVGYDPTMRQGNFEVNEHKGNARLDNKDKNYLRDYKLYLLDRFGNTQMLWDFADETSAIDPIPVQARNHIPKLTPATWQGKRSGLSDHKRAVVSVRNVYITDMPWPEEYKIKWLRVVQVFPCPSKVNTPDAGPHGSNVRMSLGIVPVEEDGSVYFEAPVEKSVYFQLLDEKKMAVHSMRSSTYIHPGERMSCVGCHEDKHNTPPLTGSPLALQRAPSQLKFEPGGNVPVSYYRLVKPIFDSKCQECHVEEGKGPQYTAYDSIAGYRKSDLKEPGYAFGFHGSGNGHINDEYVGGSRTIPGYFGAHYSRMGKALLDETHEGVVTEEEFNKITMWLDLNSMQYGSYGKSNQQRELAGEMIWPEHDATPENPQGIEFDRPLPDGSVRLKPVPTNFKTVPSMAIYDIQGRLLHSWEKEDGKDFNTISILPLK